MAGPVKDFLAKSAFSIEARAKEKAPVDTGRLRSSIHTRLAPLRAVISANAHYAPYVEFGTRPHWPPLSAMQPWARRHGFPGGQRGAFLVARAIARHGTRPQPFMAPALHQSIPDIERFLEELAQDIEKRFEQHG